MLHSLSKQENRFHTASAAWFTIWHFTATSLIKSGPVPFAVPKLINTHSIPSHFSPPSADFTWAVYKQSFEIKLDFFKEVSSFIVVDRGENQLLTLECNPSNRRKPTTGLCLFTYRYLKYEAGLFRTTEESSVFFWTDPLATNLDKTTKSSPDGWGLTQQGSRRG